MKNMCNVHGSMSNFLFAQFIFSHHETTKQKKTDTVDHNYKSWKCVVTRFRCHITVWNLMSWMSARFNFPYNRGSTQFDQENWNFEMVSHCTKWTEVKFKLFNAIFIKKGDNIIMVMHQMNYNFPALKAGNNINLVKGAK